MRQVPPPPHPKAKVFCFFSKKQGFRFSFWKREPPHAAGPEM